jgi:hypothetical protein
MTFVTAAGIRVIEVVVGEVVGTGPRGGWRLASRPVPSAPATSIRTTSEAVPPTRRRRR